MLEDYYHNPHYVEVYIQPLKVCVQYVGERQFKSRPASSIRYKCNEPQCPIFIAYIAYYTFNGHTHEYHNYGMSQPTKLLTVPGHQLSGLGVVTTAAVYSYICSSTVLSALRLAHT